MFPNPSYTYVCDHGVPRAVTPGTGATMAQSSKWFFPYASKKNSMRTFAVPAGAAGNVREKCCQSCHRGRAPLES